MGTSVEAFANEMTSHVLASTEQTCFELNALLSEERRRSPAPPAMSPSAGRPSSASRDPPVLLRGSRRRLPTAP